MLQKTDKLLTLKDEGPVSVDPALYSVSEGDIPATNVSAGNSPLGSYSVSNAFIALSEKISQENSSVKIQTGLSPARLSWYLKVADNNLPNAIALHSWNAELAASVLPALQVAEVTLRNFVIGRICATYGKSWFNNSKFRQKITKSQKDKLDAALSKVMPVDISPSSKILTNKLANELTFGFWVNVLTNRHKADMWTRPLWIYRKSIPSDVSLIDLEKKANAVRRFRNHVAHHKNLVRRPHRELLVDTETLIEWMCPNNAECVRSLSRFKTILSNPPCSFNFQI